MLSRAGGPTCIDPTLIVSSFGLIWRQGWGIKREFYEQGYENVEGRAMTNGDCPQKR